MSETERDRLPWLAHLLIPGVLVVWGVGRFFDPSPDKFASLEALFSGLAFAGLIVAILLQRQELTLQRKELELTREVMKDQKKQLELQNETFRKDNFENTFFRLLRTHFDLVTSIKASNVQGPPVFKTLLQRLLSTDNNVHESRDLGILIGKYNRFLSHLEQPIDTCFQNSHYCR